MVQKYKVIIETDIVDRPKEHELSAALILANYFASDVVFLRPESRRTPDIRVGLELWEIKSPTGDGKKTIDNNLRSARKQSRNIVLDLRRTKMHKNKALARVRYYLEVGTSGIQRLVIITKSGSVIEI